MDKLEMLMQDRGMTLFDCIMAEIMDDRNAEKARVRNRRKADRKAKRKYGAYIKRNGGKFRKDEHYAGDKFLHYPESLMMPETRVRSKEKYDRKDWEREQAEIYAEIYDGECLSEQIEQAKKECAEMADTIDNRACQLEGIAQKLRSMKDPTDWESLYMYLNAVKTAEWYSFG